MCIITVYVAKKNKPKISNLPSDLIKPTEINNNDTPIKFSFVNLDLKNKKYSIENIKDNKEKAKLYDNLITKLHEYSTHKNFKKYISDNGPYRDKNHIHPIDWNDERIREKSFTNMNSNEMEQIKDDCWQLGINGTTFRIHGYFIDNIFYVVWLDPLHNLYHSK